MKLKAFLLPLLMGISLGGAMLTQAPQRTQPGASDFLVLQSAVRISHEWEQIEGDSVLRYSVPSLGTSVGPQTVISHNHYHPTPGGLLHETMRFTAPDDAQVALEMPQVTFQSIGPETARFTLASPLNIGLKPASVADAAAIEALRPGSLLTLVYWDDPTARLAQRDFAIVALDSLSITVSDPEHVINGGDSGGGAFYQGRFVGSTWGFLVDQDGDALGLVKVALKISE